MVDFQICISVPLNKSVPAARLLKYVRPFGGHQALKG